MEDLDEIKIKESQVKQIINMLRDEFDLEENDEIIDTKEGNDEGFFGTDSNSAESPGEDRVVGVGSEEEKKELEDTPSRDEGVVNELAIEDDYMTSENDMAMEVGPSRQKAYKELSEFVDKAVEFGANALDLSKRALRKLPKSLLLLGNLQVRIWIRLLLE